MTASSRTTRHGARRTLRTLTVLLVLGVLAGLAPLANAAEAPTAPGQNRTYISYDALRRNASPGRSNVGQTPANAYTRGCSAITRCRG